MHTDRGNNLGQLVGLSIMALMLVALVAGQVSKPELFSAGSNAIPSASATADRAARPVTRP
jgi:hypothetical protein